MSGSQVAHEDFAFANEALESLGDIYDAPQENIGPMTERRGDAVGIGMILTFQFLIGLSVGWMLWG